jgi:hypothetical protein
MGHTPKKFGEWGWGDSHTGTKKVNATKREKEGRE